MDLNATVARLGILVLERLSGETFVRRGTPPSWIDQLGTSELRHDAPFSLDDVFPFLSIFLPDAQACWEAGGDAHADSGFWTERTSSGVEVHLEATALRVGGLATLVVRRNERLFTEQQLVLQRARELRLTHTQLVRETEQKDVLMHCIVHDLAVPLNGVISALPLIADLACSDAAKRWLDLAMSAAMRQRQLIRDILEVFADEYREAGGAGDMATSTDVGAAITTVVNEAGPTARTVGASIVVDVGEGPWLVRADDTRLVRVLGNLVGNALEHSPRGSRVAVTTRREDHAVRITVDDEGPGVSPEVLTHLFERFATAKHGDGTGLGLYFCRITVERWGGGIGYERRGPTGSRFWVRLPASDPPRREVRGITGGPAQLGTMTARYLQAR